MSGQELRDGWNICTTACSGSTIALLYSHAVQRCRAAGKDRAGKVAEWSNALDSKSSVRLWRTVGSNPTLSAKNIQDFVQSIAETRNFLTEAAGFLLGGAKPPLLAL